MCIWKEDIKKRLISAQEDVSKRNSTFTDFDLLNTIMLIKSLGSIGKTIEHEHDIFLKILIFLFTFQGVPQTRIF